MIETSILISAATIGFRCITGKGMIFYFLREWLDKKAEFKKTVLFDIEETQKRLKRGHKNGVPNTKEEQEVLIKHLTIFQGVKFKKTDALLYAFKPIILCSTCMASIHSIIWFPIITGGFDWTIVLIMLIVAFFNTVGFGLVELIQAGTNRLNAGK